MRFVYSSIMYLLAPYLLLRLWWKGRKLPAYRQRIAERFCLDNLKQHDVDAWVHAVSLGEVIAATPLINAMLDKQWSVLVTTMTPTGSERVKTQFGDKVSHRYVPYDLPKVLRRFFKHIKPRVAVIMETELWPNLIFHTHDAGIPLLLANARLSERSAQGYLRFAFFFKSVLNCFTAILAQSQDDANRFNSLGARGGLAQVLGNMKFDLQTSTVDKAKCDELKKQWGFERPAVIAASTHHDEESQIIAQLKRLQQAIPHVVLLIAPRHPERFQAVFQLSKNAGFNTGLRSSPETLSPANEVVILDSLGELLGMYQVSDYAFVGGSLVPVGGHNVLEPIAMQVPVISGNQIHNFKAICSDLEKADAIQLVSNPDQLIDAIIKLHHDQTFKTETVKKATAVLEANKGAVLKHLNTIKGAMRVV